ncbi:exported hypothetical protein [Hyella patelloides LEGE 07179]|uniref:Uncharacterized protein n=1 Tax=Hyella patelloides LEGE 07179 TaxID=945734 RepID=A0A563W561_9CYAN|nr:hypothetical protein [Hyella patelloides]VEP18673.1 exported hypothetical protein [Hyella patelloides LEGE 07179]
MKIRLLLSSLTVFLAAGVAFGQETDYRLVVRPNSRVSQIPLGFVCEDVPLDDLRAKKMKVIASEGGQVTFWGNKDRVRTTLNGELILPYFRVNTRGITYLAQIGSPKEGCSFKIHTPDKRQYFTSVVDNMAVYKGMIAYQHQNWILVNESKKKLIENSFNSDRTFPEEGISTTFIEGKNIKRESRGVCSRLYLPGTRWGSGQVYWAIRDPRRAGFSIKGEHDDSGFVNALRCPKGNGQTEYQVDGVYKRRLPLVALKVPDHCTATPIRTGRSKHAWNCCCNAAATLLGGRCKYIPTIPLDTWANQGRQC